jgi:hypothetical protein
MKTGKILTATIAATLLFSSNAFAVRQKQTTKGTLHLSEEVIVEGKQLAPGDYKVRTENNGSQATVNIMNGKETTVSVPAQTKPADINESHAYMTTDEPNGTKELTAVYLHGTEFEFLDNQNAPQPEGQ